jgi:hypothetical protein
MLKAVGPDNEGHTVDASTGFCILPDDTSKASPLRVEIGEMTAAGLKIIETRDLSSQPAPVVMDRQIPAKIKSKTKKTARQVEIVEVPARHTEVFVELNGPFGSIRAPYSEVFEDSKFVVLISDKDKYSYIPPETEETMSITFQSKTISVQSVGISFQSPTTGQTTIVLIKEE